MKILFICKSNFGRSQIAESLFNHISNKHVAISAGIETGRVTGHKLKEFPEHENLFICMDEIGIELRDNIAKRLKAKMLNDVDIVVSMIKPELLPKLINKRYKIIYWDIKDMCGESLGIYRNTRDKIQKNVENLVKEIEINRNDK